jgi:hypothetical protein
MNKLKHSKKWYGKPVRTSNKWHCIYNTLGGFLPEKSGLSEYQEVCWTLYGIVKICINCRQKCSNSLENCEICNKA